MTVPIISFAEGDALLDWIGLTDALAEGHKRPKAEIADTFLYRGSDTLLNRAAWIDGLGLAVKSATIFPGNPAQGLASVNGGVTLYSDRDGTLAALIDFHLVTKWKTAGDSLLAARMLARPDSRAILIVGAGTQAKGLHAAYSAAFPEACLHGLEPHPRQCRCAGSANPRPAGRGRSGGCRPHRRHRHLCHHVHRTADPR